MADGSDDANHMSDGDGNQVPMLPELRETDAPELDSCPTPDPPIPVGTPGPLEGPTSLAKIFEKIVEPALHPSKAKKHHVTASMEVWIPLLQTLSETGRLGESARAVGTCTMTIWNWRKQYPEFDAACQEALHIYKDRLLAEVHRRGVKGVCEPVFYQGEVCGKIRRFSDPLLTLLAKKHDPELRDGPQIQTNIGGVLVVNQPAKTEDEWLATPVPPLLPSVPAPEPPTEAETSTP